MKKVLVVAVVALGAICTLNVQPVKAQAPASLGKWVDVYGGYSFPQYEECIKSSAEDCKVGDTRKPQSFTHAY